MDKNNFFTRLARWPRIVFTDVQILAIPADNSRLSPHELYVRDRSEPPARLFICHLAKEADVMRVERTYQLWLEEYTRPQPAVAERADSSLYSHQPAHLLLSPKRALPDPVQAVFFSR